MVSEAAASTCKSFTRSRCPNIHRHVDKRRNTGPPLNTSSPRRCLQEGSGDYIAAIARPGIRSLGFLPGSQNDRGCRRSSTASISKKKMTSGAIAVGTDKVSARLSPGASPPTSRTGSSSLVDSHQAPPPPTRLQQEELLPGAAALENPRRAREHDACVPNVTSLARST
jgi:hypothetical protein